ncbi:MAG: hypothetical protein L3J58_03160 [Emcibacter sp.]|nr:hypothetical protein [Emcibacter sp.]
MTERKKSQQLPETKSKPETESKSGPKPEPKSGPKATKSGTARGPNWSLRLLLLLLVFLIGSGAGIYFLPALKDKLPFVANWSQSLNNSGASNKEIRALSDKISLLDRRLTQQNTEIQELKTTENDLNSRLEEITAQKTDTGPALIARLEKLEQAGLLAESKKNDMSQSARIDMLLGRMSQLEASFVPLSKGLSDAQDARQERQELSEITKSQAEVLDQIGRRLSAVEAYADRDNSGALLAFRIGELRRKVTSGQAFGPEISALSSMMARGSFANNGKLNDAISWLSQHKAGIVPKDKIRDQFDNLIPALIRSASRHADDPWWKRAYNNGKNLIMVRKTNSIPEAFNTEGFDAENLDGIIANVRQMLARFDLKESLALLNRLPGNIRETLNIWVMQAEIYLRAETELDRVESLAAAYYLDPETAAPMEGASL